MKHRLLSLCLLLCMALSASAVAYKVEEIPNVHVGNRTHYVSNPDGMLSDDAVAVLDTMLARVWRDTSAEMVVVAVDDIDELSDIDTFATELFGHWGIGKKDNDNGLLVLIVKNRREVVVRTGYGMEGVVPDILAGKLIRHELTPRYRDGDYDGGTLALVGQLAGAVTDESVREELMSKYANDARSGDDDDEAFFRIYLVFAMALTVGSFVAVAAAFLVSRGKSPVARHYELSRLKLPLLVASFLGLGGPFPAYLLMLWLVRRIRYSHRRCPQCRSRMKMVPHTADAAFLTPAQQLERRLDSVDYDVWQCASCNFYETAAYPNPQSPYRECPVCHAHTMAKVSDVVEVSPTTMSVGQGCATYHCANCGHDKFKRYQIPKVVAPPIIIGGRGGFGGGGFSGGSFGGGMTGGGGARGGW